MSESTAAHLYRAIQDQQTGQLITGATVTLCNPGTTAAIGAQLYSDPALSQTLSNPFVCGSGIIDVYLADPQTIQLMVAYGSATDLIDNLTIVPPVERLVITDFPVEITNSPTTGDSLVAIDAATAAWTPFDVSDSGFLPRLIGWVKGGALALSNVVRDGHGALLSANVVWPDGTSGVYTTDAVSPVFPGRVDAYHVTWVTIIETVTLTQAAVTRDAMGNIVTCPPITTATS